MSKVIGEVWKPIPNYEGFYEASNTGKVRSIYRYKRILKPRISNTGYERVDLFKNKSRKQFSVHRLVAMTFVNNPDAKPFVNHKDENKTNNSVSNLEWCDNRYNSYYGTKDVKMCKRVCQYGKDGAYIATFRSAHQAAEAIGLSVSSISAAALGKLKTAGGFVWQYL